MAVTGIHQGEIALLVDGRKFEIIPFEYSQGFIDKSLPVLEAFWSQHVLKRIPPPPIKLKDMVKLYPDSNDAVEMVSDEVLANYEELISVREQLKVYESREAELKLSIQDYMKQSDTLVDGERVLCTWKTSTSRRFNQKRFAADYPELFQEYKDDSSQRRFLPKTPKK
jgi:predicted phage-related endonuclease